MSDGEVSNDTICCAVVFHTVQSLKGNDISPSRVSCLYKEPDLSHIIHLELPPFA
jgi:hypothetical protein